MKYIKGFNLYLIIILILFHFYSCGSSSNLEQVQNYSIDYYTTGGVTGMSYGLTVDSEGQLKFWNGAILTNRIVTDSLKLENDDVSILSKLLEDPTIFNFKYKETGNLTTIIKITSDRGSNIISYSGTITGNSFPHKIKELVSELNKLKNKR